MLKECVIDGKLYLCKKQASSDYEAEKYSGSGLKVLEYKKKFGNNCMRHKQTLIKMPVEREIQFNRLCFKTSKQLDVVSSDLYLNIIDEIGQGGSTKATNGMVGKKYVHKGNVNKVIRPELVNEYINQGWSLGFSLDKRQQISKSQKGKIAWNKGKKMKPKHLYKTIPYVKKTKKEKFKNRSLARKKLYSNSEYKKLWSAPRKPLLNLVNVESGEVIEIGRYDAVKKFGIGLCTIFKGRVSKGYKLNAPRGI